MNLPVLDLDYGVTKASIARPNSHADDTATPSAAENTSRQVHVRKIKALYQEPESKSLFIRMRRCTARLGFTP